MKIKQVPLDLPTDFVMMLDAFCEAHRGSPRTRIIRDGVEALIEADLANNPGLRARYDDALQRLRQEAFSVIAGGTEIPFPTSPRHED